MGLADAQAKGCGRFGLLEDDQAEAKPIVCGGRDGAARIG